jgi:hypothetical protein
MLIIVLFCFARDSASASPALQNLSHSLQGGLIDLAIAFDDVTDTPELLVKVVICLEPLFQPIAVA